MCCTLHKYTTDAPQKQMSQTKHALAQKAIIASHPKFLLRRHLSI